MNLARGYSSVSCSQPVLRYQHVHVSLRTAQPELPQHGSHLAWQRAIGQCLAILRRWRPLYRHCTRIRARNPRTTTRDSDFRLGHHRPRGPLSSSPPPSKSYSNGGSLSICCEWRAQSGDVVVLIAVLRTPVAAFIDFSLPHGGSRWYRHDPLCLGYDPASLCR